MPPPVPSPDSTISPAQFFLTHSPTHPKVTSSLLNPTSFKPGDVVVDITPWASEHMPRTLHCWGLAHTRVVRRFRAVHRPRCHGSALWTKLARGTVTQHTHTNRQKFTMDSPTNRKSKQKALEPLSGTGFVDRTLELPLRCGVRCTCIIVPPP